MSYIMKLLPKPIQLGVTSPFGFIFAEIDSLGNAGTAPHLESVFLRHVDDTHEDVCYGRPLFFN
jgi:hypothetical protein